MALWGFPGGSDGNESACNAGDLGSIPGLGRSPGVENGSSILAQESPWTEEPGRLQSVRLQSRTPLGNQAQHNAKTLIFDFIYAGGILRALHEVSYLILTT